MKLIYASNSVLPSRSANSNHVMQMCDAYAANGHQVTLLAPDRAEEAMADDVLWDHYGVKNPFTIRRTPWHAWARTIGNMMLEVRRMPRILEGVRPDALHARSLPAAAAASRAGVPTVCELHVPPKQEGSMMHRLYKQFLCGPGAVATVVITQALADEIRRVYGDVPITVLADAARDEGAPAVEPAVKAVGYMGHLYPGRGIETVIALAGRCLGTPFHVVGGTDADLAHWRSSDIPTNLTFHGHVPPSKLSAHRARCAVLLAPYASRVSGVSGKNDTSQWMSPLKIFEYMAAGRAIIASDLPAIHEVLEDGRNSLLAAPDDIDAWDDALTRLLSDDAMRQELGRMARRDFEERYTWSARAAAIARLFENA